MTRDRSKSWLPPFLLGCGFLVQPVLYLVSPEDAPGGGVVAAAFLLASLIQLATCIMRFRGYQRGQSS